MPGLLTRMRFETIPGRWVRKLRRRYNEQCVNIVTYHSIGTPPNVLHGGASRHSTAEFERQVDYLADNYSIISLRALVESLEREEPPQRAIVLTFDDGYSDTLRRAMPILFRRRIPMTVFLSTAAIGNRDLLWPHKLSWLLAAGQEPRIEQSFQAAGIGGRRPGESMGQFARRCFRNDIPDILESNMRALGTSGASVADEMRPYAEPEEIARADGEFVEFCNHTHTHPVLSALTREQQHREIATAREIILSLTGRTPLALAYPFGLKRHYNDDSKCIAQETWHRATLDMRRRMNEGVVDPYELSRKPAPVGSQRLFEQMIEDWPAHERANGGGE